MFKTEISQIVLFSIMALTNITLGVLNMLMGNLAVASFGILVGLGLLTIAIDRALCYRNRKRREK